MRMIAVVGLVVGVLSGIVLGEATTRPASTTKPSENVETRTRVVHPFETLANSLPKKYWPTKDETQAIQKLRKDWLKENFIEPDNYKEYLAGKMPVWKWTGTVQEVSEGGHKGEVRVKLKLDDMQIWGNWMKVELDATIVNAPASMMEWSKGKVVTVNGLYMHADWSSEQSMRIRTVSELPTAPKAASPKSNKPAPGRK